MKVFLFNELTEYTQEVALDEVKKHYSFDSFEDEHIINLITSEAWEFTEFGNLI